MNNDCFKCQRSVNGNKFLKTKSGVLFHWACVFAILDEHVSSTLKYEAHIADLAAAHELADKLGFSDAHAIEEREAIQSELPLSTPCVRCGQELGFHSTDTDTCPDGSGRVFCLVRYPNVKGGE